MAVPVHMEMHCDHKHWLNEFALWQEFLHHWREELGGALRDIDRLKSALECHDKALREHGAELDRERARIEEHEHALADHERGGTEPKLVSMAQEHRAETAHQQERRAIHERLKKHHHLLLAHWRLLFGAITQPM